MLSITLLGQKCNNLIRDSQSYLTYQNNFNSEIGGEVSLVCYVESIFSSYESFYDVTNNFVHKFFNALLNTRSKYMLQYLKFAFFWLFKGNQYEFLTHPKIKIRTDFLSKARRTQTLNINISGYVNNIIIEFINIY